MNTENQKEPLLFGSMTYTQIMQLRAAYNLGTRNEETRAAANLYEKLRKLKMLDKLKQEAMTRHDGEQQ
ncbi:hypothetical protein LLH92_004008 [Acinetobacter baumannii]|nr:hypothetical protein [Acinetobacter baumannii]EKT8133660.1 hypothetical protein [Acinetobacter baumannii]EKT8137322.1 hypothetical protein [Acinetobacter baumannii]EKU7951851.1 hypothetical protein [Acinetobacter baumannii]EKU7955564.1 hypothetical protein [Acinetobacter baumannii]